MPINNPKGLEALKALSSGGSAGLSSYKQAQAAEAQSRTGALQQAIGTQDLGAAVNKAQAQYAPKVTGGGLGIDNLNVAADQYLSQAANKLASRNYEDQQNLTLQAEALRRKQNEVSEEDRQAMLLGASDAMAAQQRGDLEANLQGGGLGNLATRKALLREQLTKYDSDLGQNAAFAAISGNPADMERIKAGRQAILDQMGALDQQFAQASGQYTGMLGTDNKGLLEAYNAADRGDTAQVQGLVDFLNPRREQALAEGNRSIDVGEQARLRQLAPAFGVDPLVAAGTFRESEGKELGRIGQQGKEQDYVAGQDPAALADAFGFANPGDLNAAKKATGLDEQGIADTLSDPAWQGVDDLAGAFVAGDQTNPLIAGNDERETRTGIEGFRAAIQDYAAQQIPMPEGATDEQKREINQARTQIINLAINRYKSQIGGAAGTGTGLKDESE